jgi:hypothetical protein
MRAASRNCSEWSPGIGLANAPARDVYRGDVMMSDNRPPVLDAALVALLLALAFDALSTALVWGLIQHLPS